MAARITLDEFMRLPLGVRRNRFDDLSVADQLSFVESAGSVELIMGGYPTKERILAVLGGPDLNPANAESIH